MSNQNSIAGIIGGVGPKASVDILNKIIEGTPANKDQEHVKVLLYNNPKIPNRVESIQGDDKELKTSLTQTATTLESAGADFLTIASNLTHFYFDIVDSAVQIPVINMIFQTVNWVFENVRPNKAGVLAPSATIESSLYQNNLKQRNIQPVVLGERKLAELVDESIYGDRGIKAGYITPNVKPLNSAVNSLVQEGAEVIIMACTEIPLCLDNESVEGVPLVNPNAILANKIVDICQ